MDEQTKHIRAALKQKWMQNDHNINITKMAAFYKTPPEQLRQIITQYESELIATKFVIIE